MNKDYIVGKITILVVLVMLFWGVKILFGLNDKEYKNSIVNEVEYGVIVDSNKTQLKGLLGESIVYETAIQVGNEIIISNDKKIYYKAKDKVKQEIKVEVKNNKDINYKKIVDIE